MVFKNKRQKKDFETIAQNIYFDLDKNVKNNGLNCVLIDLKSLSEEDFLKSVDFIKKLNNKNIIINKNQKMISID